MKVKREVISNYLSKIHYSYGKIVSIALLVICMVMSKIYWDFERGLGGLLYASPNSVFEQGEHWRPFTSSFIHGDFEHLLSNSLMFTFLGYLISSFYGAFVFPVLTVLMGGVINYCVLLSFSYDIRIVGASGMVYFLWGFWLMLYILISRHIKLYRRLMKVTAISLLLLIPTSYEPTTSYLAHAIGLILGIGCGVLYFPFKRRYIQSFERTMINIKSFKNPYRRGHLLYLRPWDFFEVD